VREGRNVALVMAGLPPAVSDLLNDNVLTFLRRAVRFTLTKLTGTEATAALSDPLVAGGCDVTPAALQLAVEACGGYPFMVQILGYQIWRLGRTGRIGTRQVRDLLPLAWTRLAELVLEPALADLSKRDRDYLTAMAADEGPSCAADLADRLGISAENLAQYRRRLLAAGLIEAPRRGYVDYALPHLRDYLRQAED
jgi:DNA-binding transcriptional ArsR family regulator